MPINARMAYKTNTPFVFLLFSAKIKLKNRINTDKRTMCANWRKGPGVETANRKNEELA